MYNGIIIILPNHWLLQLDNVATHAQLQLQTITADAAVSQAMQAKARQLRASISVHESQCDAVMQASTVQSEDSRKILANMRDTFQQWTIERQNTGTAASLRHQVNYYILYCKYSYKELKIFDSKQKLICYLYISHLIHLNFNDI